MNDVEKSYKEVTAGLFWGNKNKMDTVSPQEIKVVQDFIANPRDRMERVEEAWDNAQRLANGERGGMTPEQTRQYKEITQSLIQNFTRITNVFQNHGLWPHYDGKRYRSTHDQFMGLTKFAAEFRANAIGPKVLKFLEESPVFLKEAVQDLKNEKDPSYLDGLYRLVYDSLMDKDGLVTSLEELVKVFGNESAKEPEGKPVSTEEKKKKIQWIGTDGIQQISQAINKVIEKKKPVEGSPDRAKFDQVVEDATTRVVGSDWSGRLKGSLEKFGFKADGSFDRKAFESRFRQFEDLVKTAAEGDFVGSLPDLKKEFLGTYDSYLRALQEYKDSPEWSKAVTDTYFELILDGKDNLYKALKSLHDSIKKETAGVPDSTEPAKAKEEPEDSKPEDTEAPEEGKPEEQAPANEEQGDGGYSAEEMGEKGPNSPVAPDRENLVNEIRQKGSFTSGFRSYHNGTMKAWYRQNGKVDKAWLSRTLDQVMSKLGNRLDFSEDVLNRPRVLETIIKSKHSPFSAFYNALDEALYDARPGVTTPADVVSEVTPAADKLKAWGEAFYKDFLKRSKEQAARAKADEKEQGGTVTDKPAGTGEKPATPEVSDPVTPENASKMLQELADRIEEKGEVLPEDETQAEAIAEVLVEEPGSASPEVPSTRDVEKAEAIVDYLERVEAFVAKKEDPEEALDFARGALSKALVKAREVLDNKELVGDIGDQVKGLMKYLFDNRGSIKSVEEVESLLGKLGDGINSELDQIKGILNEIRSKAKAMQSVQGAKLILNTDSIVQESANIWTRLKAPEDPKIEPSQSEPAEEKVPDDSNDEHRDLGNEVHTALLEVPDDLYEVADIVAMYLQYGKSEYMGDGVLSGMGVGSEAKDLLRSAKALVGRNDGVNKKSFLASLDKFAKALGDKTDFDRDPELVEEYDSMIKDLGSHMKESNPVVKTASSPLVNRVVEAFLNKKASVPARSELTVYGYPGSESIDSSRRKDATAIRGAIGRILARAHVPQIGVVTADLYNKGAYTIKDVHIPAPPRPFGNPFKENYRPGPAVKAPKGDPNQQSLF